MKVGIITFHASHNYGSMLQAYALQQTILRMGHECEIINFRTERQKRFYRPFYLVEGWRSKLKSLVFPKLAFNDWRKYCLFERFLKEKLILSKNEYSTSEELTMAGFDYDVYISGSDQIWNTSCFDFDWSYFLNFVKNGKKVAYAPSMGPDPENQVTEDKNNRIVEYLNDYKSFSVREKRTAERIVKTGLRKPLSILLDPTLLLSKNDWDKVVRDVPLVDGRYIFLYTPWYNEKIYKIAEEYAEIMDVKIIVSKPEYPFKWYYNKRFVFFNAVGPLEFINLIKFSTIVIAESFHAVVFSLIYNKTFIISGLTEDSRVNNIINFTGLKVKKMSNDIIQINSSETKRFLNRLSLLVDNSMLFLNDALA